MKSKAIQSANVHAATTHARAKADLYGEEPCKTIPLDELLKQATPLPWRQHDGFIAGKFRADGLIHDIADPRCAPPTDDMMPEMDANAALLAHAANVLPELVSLLQSAHEAAANCEDSLEGLIELRGWLESRLESTLAKATTVQIK